ncbi:MAG TPA: PAS domain S-box protein [Opitutaceae bacterium]|nr:PAS domain S-box protein [Opitutaceae bacterium]
MPNSATPPTGPGFGAPPPGLLDRAPVLVAAFRLPDLSLTYLNSAGLRHLDPDGTATAEKLGLQQILGVESYERFRRDILPQVLVLGRWSGTFGLRDARGSVFQSRTTLVALDRHPNHSGAALGVFAQLPSAASNDEVRSNSDEEMLHALLDSTPDRIAFKDLNSRYLRISRSKATMHRLSDPAGAIGKTDFDFFSVEHAAAAFDAEQTVLRTGEACINVEERSVYEDGRIAWTSTSRLPFRDRAGKLVGTFTIAHDITDRKVAEEALRESEVVFRSIFEGSNDAILLYLDDRFFDCNPRTVEMFGCAKEQLLGLTLGHLSPPAQPDGRDSATTTAEFTAAAYREGFCRFDWILRRHDGTDFHSEILLAAFDFGGRRILQATIRDITERKRAEAQRREMELQLQLSQKLESVGRLAAGVAHELNTPTQFVSDNLRFLVTAFTQLDRVLAAHRDAFARANDHPDCAPSLATVRAVEEENELSYLLGEIPRTLDQSMEGLGRITKIVTSLKEFSHPGGKEMSGADLNRAIETTVAVSRHEWKYVATVVTELDPLLPQVPCVLDEFNQAVLNLVVNAAHAIEEANIKLGRTLGRIVIRTRHEPGWAVVEVEDNGTGIPPEVQPRIFEPFFTTKGIGRGTGQGLAIVRNVVVKTHQGRLDFITEVGRGTTFRLALPLPPDRAIPHNPATEKSASPAA